MLINKNSGQLLAKTELLKVNSRQKLNLKLRPTKNKKKMAKPDNNNKEVKRREKKLLLLYNLV